VKRDKIGLSGEGGEIKPMTAAAINGDIGKTAEQTFLGDHDWFLPWKKVF